jgi:hypothetical protein
MQRRYVYMIECNVQNGWNRTGEVFDLALFDSPVARRGRPPCLPCSTRRALCRECYARQPQLEECYAKGCPYERIGDSRPSPMRINHHHPFRRPGGASILRLLLRLRLIAMTPDLSRVPVRVLRGTSSEVTKQSQPWIGRRIPLFGIGSRQADSEIASSLRSSQ